MNQEKIEIIEEIKNSGIPASTQEYLIALVAPDVRTNGDAIRSMSDEELTKAILCPYDTAGEEFDIMPCIKEFGSSELPGPEYCNECMVNWLKRPRKVVKDEE